MPDRKNNDYEQLVGLSWTNQEFNRHCANMHGMKLLKYVESDDFSGKNESTKFLACVNVSGIANDR